MKAEWERKTGCVCNKETDVVCLFHADLDEYILAGAINEKKCEGHYDDDNALISGAAIGEPVYCDGSCNN